LSEVVSGEIVLDKKESSDYGWFSVDEALELKLYPGTKKFFSLVKNNKLKI
jgi:NADH pyrophosphatase NudC (nudix superfamily)